MAKIDTNAIEVEREFRARADHWDRLLDISMRKSLIALDRESVKLLSGHGDPWTYPVPVRSGNLRRSQRTQQPSPVLGFVLNVAGYARAIHSGLISVGRGPGRKTKQFRARPWLIDAAERADVPGIFKRTFDDGLLTGR